MIFILPEASGFHKYFVRDPTRAWEWFHSCVRFLDSWLPHATPSACRCSVLIFRHLQNIFRAFIPLVQQFNIFGLCLLGICNCLGRPKISVCSAGAKQTFPFRLQIILGHYQILYIFVIFSQTWEAVSSAAALSPCICVICDIHKYLKHKEAYRVP